MRILSIIVDQSFARRCRRTGEAVAVAEILLMGGQKNMPHVAGAVFVGVEGEFMAEVLPPPPVGNR